MVRKLVVLPRALHDADEIFEWMSGHSTNGAEKWWDAFQEALKQVQQNAESFGLAPEHRYFDRQLRQYLFKIPRGRRYRMVYVVEQQVAYILGVRGPGQAPLTSEDLV